MAYLHLLYGVFSMCVTDEENCPFFKSSFKKNSIYKEFWSAYPVCYSNQSIESTTPTLNFS